MVQVYRRRRKADLRRLGDFDEAGTHLADELHSYLAPGRFWNRNEDGDRSVVCETSVLENDDDVRCTFQHGESGTVARIVDADGQLRFRQEADHTHLVRCASLLRLPHNRTLGWWAVHINNRRSAKNLIESKLIEMFRHQHEDLTLKITPFVRGDDLQAAVEANKIDRVTLVKYKQPSDRAVAATEKWVRDGDAGTIELQITGKNHLKTGLLRRFVDGDRTAFSDILTFEGMEFDEAKVQVELGDRHRTINIEKPEAGHALTVEMDDLTIIDGEPSSQSLFAALGRALDDVT